MKKTCPLCLYSGDSKYIASRPSRLLLGGFMLGLGLVFVSSTDFPTKFEDFPIFSIFFEIIIFSIALYIILGYYSMVRNLCSKCTNEEMVENNSPEAQELIKQNDLNEITTGKQISENEKICTNCVYIGQETITQYLFVVWPIILIITSVGSLFFVNDYVNPTMATLAFLVLLLFSIYTLIIFFDKKEQCPNCSKSRTMIPLDTPKAQQLIKENNISIPEEAQKQSSPQSN